MLGVGPAEIFVLAVVALVIFGPGKLPEVAGQVGRAVRDFRRMTADLTGEFERTIAEVDEVKESVRKEVTGMRAEVEGVSKSVKKDLEGIAETSGGKKAAGATATKPTAVKKGAVGKGSGGRTVAKPATNGAKTKAAMPSEPVPIATKADPLADVSMLDDEPTVTSTSGPLPVGVSGSAVTQGAATVAVADAVVPTPADGGTALDQAAVAASAAPAAKGSAQAAKGDPPTNGAATGGDRPALAPVAPSDPDDALIRARRRRAEAGYRRRA